MNILLFGVSTTSGMMLKNLIDEQNEDFRIISFSRENVKNFIDLDKPDTVNNINIHNNSILVSFAPIWKLSDFLNEVNLVNKFFIDKIKMIIACSSTSIETKRYSSNKFDKDLVQRLKYAENLITGLCSQKQIICRIIRPTLIYGSVGNFRDKNFSKIKLILRLFPLILLPKNSGLRQPIHCSELANFILHIIRQGHMDKNITQKTISVGGDITIRYSDLIKELSYTIPKNFFLGKCMIISIPNRVFFFLITPICMISPKIYESLLRITSDLNGFMPIHKLIKSKPNKKLLIYENKNNSVNPKN